MSLVAQKVSVGQDTELNPVVLAGSTDAGVLQLEVYVVALPTKSTAAQSPVDAQETLVKPSPLASTGVMTHMLEA